MRRFIPVFLAAALWAAPAQAQQPPLGESLAKASRSGDTTLMSGLRGARTPFAAAVVRIYRETRAYRDYLVAADPSFAPNPRGTLQFLVRVTGNFLGAPVPAEVSGMGLVHDFEMEPAAGKLRWYPVLLLDRP